VAFCFRAPCAQPPPKILEGALFIVSVAVAGNPSYAAGITEMFMHLEVTAAATTLTLFAFDGRGRLCRDRLQATLR